VCFFVCLVAWKLLFNKAIPGTFSIKNRTKVDAMSEARFGGPTPANSQLPYEMVEKYFYYRMAVVQMDPRETKEEAWGRHLAEHPGDIHANIKVFNRPALSVF
jgi:hypothetical protein